MAEPNPSTAGNPPATPPAPPAPVADTAKGAAPEPASEGFKPLLTRSRKPESDNGDSFTSIDVSKLSPENQAAFKSMQADYTRKTQALAERGREWQSERERFFDVLSKMGRGPDAQPIPENKPDRIAEIKELWNNGDVDKAFNEMISLATERAEEAVAPVKTEAAVAAMRSEFRDIVTGLNMNDPLIKQYGKEVAEVFDSPQFTKIRSAVLSSPDNMREFVPFVMRGIAAYQHAERLEATFEKAVEKRVEEVLAERAGKLKGVPSTLVRAGANTLEAPPGKMTNRRAAIDMAMSQITAGS